MRRLIGALLTAALVLGWLGGIGTAGAEQPISIVIDGQVQTLAKAPVIIDGTTLVPVRGLFENLGGQVAWEPATQTVIVARGTTSVILTVGQESATINGKSVTLTVPPQIIDGSTMVPLRVISEALGAEVHWQASSRTVDMTTHVGGTMTIIEPEPSNLFPLQVSHPAITMIYDSLLRFDNEGRLHPSLARSYQISGDGLTYTFELQPEVAWHDGKPFTANDVAYTFQILFHPHYIDRFDFQQVKGAQALHDRYIAILVEKSNGRISSARSEELQAEAWQRWIESGALQVVDSHTIRVNLETAHAPVFTGLATQLILPAHLSPASGPIGLATAPQATKPVGTGAYKFASWSKGEEMRLVRNPEWRWGVTGTRPRIAEIRFLPLSNEVAAAEVNAGRADLGRAQPGAVSTYRNVKVASFPAAAYTYMGYNLTDPLFSDLRVRQAITHAIDREKIIQTHYYGYGSVLHTHQTAGSWYNASDVLQFDYDPVRAGQLLDEAGWKMGPSGVRERNGLPLRFELATNAGNRYREQTALMIRKDLKQIGVDVQVSFMEWNAFLNHVDSDRKQAYILGWSVDHEPDSYSLFHSSGGFNMMSGLRNTEIDRLLVEGRTTTDPVDRQPIYQQLQRVLAREQIYTWLYAAPRVLVHSARLHGLRSETMGATDPFWNVETWYVDDSVK